MTQDDKDLAGMHAVRFSTSILTQTRWYLSLICLSGTLAVGLTLPDRLVAAETADTIILDTHIITMHPSQPTATAMAVKGDRIVAVGSSDDITPWIGDNTHVVRFRGRTLMPGFIDAHGHFLGLGKSQMILDLTTAKTWDEIVNQVADAVKTAPPGKWITGRGWHQNKWRHKPVPDVEGCPVHDALSRVAPDNPVILTHASGHMCIVNQYAMDLAHLDGTTAAPAGGQILRSADGSPTGVLRENAMAIVRHLYALNQDRRTPDAKRKDLLTAVRLASAECLRHGITSFQDAGSSFATIDIFRHLAQQHQLPVRLWVMVLEDNRALANRMDAYRTIGLGSNHLTVRAVKRLVDGALGSHGAWLLEPYADLPDSRGLNTLSLADLRDTAKLAIEHDYQLCVHAIGDRANQEVLNIYAAAFREHSAKHDLRWRVEHAQHLSATDIPRFAQLGVIASMQFVHATSDGPFVVERLGQARARSGAYVWKSLLRTGAVIANGTDTPVEPVNPLAGVYSAVTRKMRDGKAFFPDQCLTRREALRCYTLDAAYAAFEENIKGSITPGKLADFVVLSGDPLTVPAEQISQLRVLHTFVGGRLAYSADDATKPTQTN